MSTLEYYKLIRNSIQFRNVELVSLNCIKRKKESISNQGNEVQIMLKREVNVLSEDEAEILLHSIVGIPDGLFEFEVEYKGICFKTEALSKPQFEQYAYDQIVPLLLPYARECIASTMARMGLPAFNIPTMDVLDSLDANSHAFEDQE
ncbi:protein-export chaperone SecB [Peribacillus frigoritolerans]|uniref:protein-export chaperone SecB n=1 Tax=Peribacillus frigoritolerans TaxID=450367 RepID=UPI00381C9675